MQIQIPSSDSDICKVDLSTTSPTKQEPASENDVSTSEVEMLRRLAKQCVSKIDIEAIEEKCFVENKLSETHNILSTFIVHFSKVIKYYSSQYIYFRFNSS